MQALRALILNSGRHVDYDHMIAEAWHGTLVSKHTVAVTVGEVKDVLKEFGAWISYRPKLGYRLDVPQSDDLIRKGWHFWNRSTREGFEKALVCFQQAALDCENDARAFKGIAMSYMMLGAYGMKAPREMYAGFIDAHKRTVALSGLTPELRADRAHAMHVFERRFAYAESELLRSLEEDPNIPIVCQALAMVYSTSGRFEEARRMLTRAADADPLLPIVPVTEIFVHLCSRQYDCAVASGKSTLDLHPYLPLARALYCQALEFTGRLEAALEQARLAFLMAPDLLWIRSHEAVLNAKLGRRIEALSILDEMEDSRASDYIDAYQMAILYDAVGRSDDAFREMERAARENSAMLFMLDVDPKMDPLRQDRRFAHFRSKVFCPEQARQAAS